MKLTFDDIKRIARDFEEEEEMRQYSKELGWIQECEHEDAGDR